MNSEIHELSLDQLDAASAGRFAVVAEKGYIGIEIGIGSWGVAIWATGGSICGAVNYPGHQGGTCVPS